MEFLATTFYDNSLRTWLIALVVAVVTAVALRLLKDLGGRHIARLASANRDYLG